MIIIKLYNIFDIHELRQLVQTEVETREHACQHPFLLL